MGRERVTSLRPLNYCPSSPVVSHYTRSATLEGEVVVSKYGADCRRVVGRGENDFSLVSLQVSRLRASDAHLDMTLKSVRNRIRRLQAKGFRLETGYFMRLYLNSRTLHPVTSQSNTTISHEAAEIHKYRYPRIDQCYHNIKNLLSQRIGNTESAFSLYSPSCFIYKRLLSLIPILN